MTIVELYELTRQEIKQREEEGCAVSALRKAHEEAAAAPEEEREGLCRKILAELAELPGGAPEREPSGLEEIRRQRPQGPRVMQTVFSGADLYDRIYGGWLGRCAGCLLGKPVEGWTRAEIRAVAVPDGNYPIRDYFAPVLGPAGGRRTLPLGDPCLRGGIHGMARDDDIDYTIAGLLLLERHGLSLTPERVAELWLSELPYHKVYTAERIAYRNLVNGVPPARAGETLNPCREWIGAQIRADAFGYASPGLPEQAAGLGHADAYLSHRRNGIYGEMFVAAMLAAAFVEPDVARIIEIGLSEIPARSRLAEAVRCVMRWWDAYRGDWGRVADEIDQAYGGLQGCHVVTNAAIVVLGLLAGAEDFTAGLGVSIMPGYDTDCNGATVGSILGVRAGAAGLPEHWIAPLADRVASALGSVQSARISDLAQRTLDVASRLSASATGAAAEPCTWRTPGGPA